jgi:predicted lipase
MKMIQDLWRYAKLATSEPQNKDEFISLNSDLSDNLIEFIPMENFLDYGYIAEYENRIVFCYRGTKGKIQAWLSDFDAYPLQYDGSPVLQSGRWGEGCIHDGFYTGWSYFKPIITDYVKVLKKNKIKKELLCTGHSRGGALSTLCARHIAKNLKLSCSNISFGAPAQGTKQYRDEYNKLPIDSTYVINGYDIVPTMPPKQFGFRHVGKPFLLSQPIWHKWFCKISDHYYSSYEKKIKEL